MTIFTFEFPNLGWLQRHLLFDDDTLPQSNSNDNDDPRTEHDWSCNIKARIGSSRSRHEKDCPECHQSDGGAIADAEKDILTFAHENFTFFLRYIALDNMSVFVILIFLSQGTFLGDFM